VITLGQTETDNINPIITITKEPCLGVMGVIIEKDETVLTKILVN
jgi:hypothetical protein